MKNRWLHSPRREYVLIPLLAAGFIVDLAYPSAAYVLLGTAVIAALPTVYAAVLALFRKRVTIDTFNTFALVIAFIVTDARSAGFITLMLSFARLLDSFTRRRTEKALEALLRLKPTEATIERDGNLIEMAADAVMKDDTVVIRAGARIPVDGIVIFGSTFVNEAPVTGESVPVVKVVGDGVYSGTLVESGVLKIRATGVGKESTIERMVALMKQAAENKSQPERTADRFAAIFLPVVALIGIVTYFATNNLAMTASIFLVACADDMAVAIPLAVTAALGNAAKRGVIVKGGERLEALANLHTLVLDKTGTVTYGSLAVEKIEIAPGVAEDDFWKLVASAEKFSEHPMGRAVYRLAASKLAAVPDPEKFETITGAGIAARVNGQEVLIGSARFFDERRIKHPAGDGDDGRSSVLAAAAGKYIGHIVVSDLPRPEAGQALWRLKQLGVKKIVMFTGDRSETAARVAAALGIDEYRAGMKPEDKVKELEKLLGKGPVGMIGDGVNDAPVLARADVGIAMGGGASVAVEAADVVILTDDLNRLPETVELARRSLGVIRSDIVIWSVSNLFGFALVLVGFAGPAVAAFYNFLTDFFPLLNSARLFRTAKK